MRNVFLNLVELAFSKNKHDYYDDSNKYQIGICFCRGHYSQLQQRAIFLILYTSCINTRFHCLLESVDMPFFTVLLYATEVSFVFLHF